MSGRKGNEGGRCFPELGKRDLGTLKAETSKPSHCRALEVSVVLPAHQEADGKRIGKIDVGQLQRRHSHGRAARV
jgi:hypothetical protein